MLDGTCTSDYGQELVSFIFLYPLSMMNQGVRHTENSTQISCAPFSEWPDVDAWNIFLRRCSACAPNIFNGLRPVLHAMHYICERRAETHERFYMIEVHRHRFARHARKVPFEKCEHWRKVCGRSAKDQIASTL